MYISNEVSLDIDGGGTEIAAVNLVAQFAWETEEWRLPLVALGAESGQRLPERRWRWGLT